MTPRNKKKPTWVVDKERHRRQRGRETVLLFGLHAVRDALLNPAREKIRLLVTKNAADRLSDAISEASVEPEIVPPEKISSELDPGSVHQGALLEVKPLNWGQVKDICFPRSETSRILLLDRVSDPHNVGAILRSAEVFGAQTIIAPARHSAPETGALAKTASGALERQPYLRVGNLGNTIIELKDMGWRIVGLEGTATEELDGLFSTLFPAPTALVLGAEGPGLRKRTLDLCDHLIRIDFSGNFGSLNVSNAAAVALYATRRHQESSAGKNS